MSRMLAAAAAIALLSLFGAAMAQTPRPDRSHCNDLIEQYDRFARVGEGVTQSGKIDRAVGAERCRAGNIEQGEKDLEQAVRALGMTPVPRRK